MTTMLLITYILPIVTFGLFFAAGFFSVKFYQNFRNKRNMQTEPNYFLEPTAKYEPVPVKEKTVLTEDEKDRWQQIVTTLNKN